jgi:hypothetical protein
MFKKNLTFNSFVEIATALNKLNINPVIKNNIFKKGKENIVFRTPPSKVP